MGAKVKPAALQHVVETFVATYLQHGTEERMLIYQNAQGDHIMIRPHGPRQRGSVVCDVSLTITDNHGGLWDLIADLHSHHVMGAFWSTTDNANERVRGPIFGVFSWRDGQPKWLFRRFTGQGFVDLAPEEVVTDE